MFDFQKLWFQAFLPNILEKMDSLKISAIICFQYKEVIRAKVDAKTRTFVAILRIRLKPFVAMKCLNQFHTRGPARSLTIDLSFGDVTLW